MLRPPFGSKKPYLFPKHVDMFEILPKMLDSTIKIFEKVENVT